MNSIFCTACDKLKSNYWSHSAIFSNLPKFFSFLDITIGKESNVRKSNVLMIGEYFNWCQIWCTQMIYESCNISIPICIYTKSVSILENRIDFLIRYILRTNKTHSNGVTGIIMELKRKMLQHSSSLFLSAYTVMEKHTGIVDSII